MEDNESMNDNGFIDDNNIAAGASAGSSVADSSVTGGNKASEDKGFAGSYKAPEDYKAMESKKVMDSNKNGKKVFVVVIVLSVIAGLIQFAGKKDEPSQSHVLTTSSSVKKDDSFSVFSNKKQKDKWVHLKGTSYIAKLVVSGVIEDENKTYNQQWILDTISELKEDGDNKGIALFIDSPGGGVYQADEVYLALLDYSASGKPVYAYMGPLAASGGYYISCGAKYVMANRNTLTGSIGVLAGQFVDATGLLDKMGIKSETIHAGKNKNMGSFNEPVTDEQRKIMQAVADECYDQFVQIVSKARGMPVSSVKNLADGRIYTARQAKENSLIDAIGSFDELVAYMTKTEFSGEEYSVEDFEYEQESSFYDYLTGVASALKGSSVFSAVGLPPQTESAITRTIPYPAYFYDGMLGN